MRLAAGETICVKEPTTGRYFYTVVNDLYEYRNAYIYYGQSLTHQYTHPRTGRISNLPARASCGIIMTGEPDGLVEAAVKRFKGEPVYMVEGPGSRTGKPILNAKRSMVGGPPDMIRDRAVVRARMLVDMYWELKQNRGELSLQERRVIRRNQGLNGD